MKTRYFNKMARLLLLLLAMLIAPITGIADEDKITIDVVSKDEFVLFLLKNYEKRDFQCSEIRVQAKVVDKDGRIALRSMVAFNVKLPANSLEIRLEAGKEVIAALRSEMNQPHIVDIKGLTYRCEPKIIYVTADQKVFRDVLTDGSLGPEMVWIPAGRFRMGDIQGGGDSDEQPVHSVTINSFAMGRYGVTFAEYDKFADATGRAKPSDRGWGRGNRPVINVSWHDATAYTQWLSEQTGHQYRLPTEAEWEYAARAGTETSRYWGNDPNDACRYANVGDKTVKTAGFSWVDHNCTDGYVYTAPVGRFKPNVFGLFDMIGNTWEWTCSEYTHKYTGKEQQCVESAGDFVLRGGAWNGNATGARSAFRNYDGPANRTFNFGFRPARIR